MIRNVSTDLWHQRDVRALDADAKYLLAYLQTCPMGHMSGLFLLPLSYAVAELGISEERVRAAFSSLDPHLVRRNETSELVWIRFVLLQLPRSSKTWAGVERHIRQLSTGATAVSARLGMNSILAEFAGACDAASIPLRWGIDGVCMPPDPDPDLDLSDPDQSRAERPGVDARARVGDAPVPQVPFSERERGEAIDAIRSALDRRGAARAASLRRVAAEDAPQAVPEARGAAIGVPVASQLTLEAPRPAKRTLSRPSGGGDHGTF